jgi:hypothetical protein
MYTLMLSSRAFFYAIDSLVLEDSLGTFVSLDIIDMFLFIGSSHICQDVKYICFFSSVPGCLGCFFSKPGSSRFQFSYEVLTSYH